MVECIGRLSQAIVGPAPSNPHPVPSEALLRAGREQGHHGESHGPGVRAVLEAETKGTRVCQFGIDAGPLPPVALWFLLMQIPLAVNILDHWLMDHPSAIVVGLSASSVGWYRLRAMSGGMG